MLPLFIELRKLGAYIAGKESYLTGPAQLLELYREQLKNESVELPNNFFEGYLKAGKALVLLDGLDEVADVKLRQRIADLVERFTNAWPDCRYVVSSRIAGYTGLGAGYHEATIREFRDVDIEQFVTNWHRIVAVKENGPGPAAEREAA